MAGGRAGLAEPVVQPGRQVGDVRQRGTKGGRVQGDGGQRAGRGIRAQAEPVAAGHLWLVIELGAERLGVTAGA